MSGFSLVNARLVWISSLAASVVALCLCVMTPTNAAAHAGQDHHRPRLEAIAPFAEAVEVAANSVANTYSAEARTNFQDFGSGLFPGDHCGCGHPGCGCPGYAFWCLGALVGAPPQGGLPVFHYEAMTFADSAAPFSEHRAPRRRPPILAG